MEYLYEGIVLGYLSQRNKFVCPQYSIKAKGGKQDWRCPDFVVLDLEEKRVILAEVTTSWSLRDFVEKAVELNDAGKDKVRKQLTETKGLPYIRDWQISILLFVREDRRDYLEAQLKGRIPFEIVTLEDAFRRWKWESRVAAKGA